MLRLGGKLFLERRGYEGEVDYTLLFEMLYSNVRLEMSTPMYLLNLWEVIPRTERI